MAEKKGYILLTDTGTLFTKLIKLYTNNTYNHASIAFFSDLSEVYSFGRKYARNPFIGGFVQEDTKSGLFKKANCAIYSFHIKEWQLKMVKQYIQEIQSKKEQYHYNFIGLFGFLLNKPIKRNKAFFCSQFVASVLEESGIYDFEKPLSLIAPYDLKDIPALQLEFQGKLSDYHNYCVISEKEAPFPFSQITIEI
ncbi:hypothetical protein ACFQ4Z_04055 [Oceanobacillus oncorhynchi subsp. oncorhynchi]|uniref:hypothetical protein n=1 Tax=Oceanobacillus oncorhynchi TaxID=545501 RepID=UPI00364298F5